ncbi:amidase [Halalkalibacter sp. APA_J-10(15)]|uniref:amidase n=1 Tax=unclassified Halalkalibacter TaxID=2893063 RepID=UPI001FF5AA60|nr:amidase [Halalkalibacter sp. APA_J-10(15)]MCK0472865.1 amidase [Halalkalibacter sp. APA_J-10(15)]
MDKWNAFKKNYLNLYEAEEGSLKGMTFAVKDVFAVKGIVAGAGNPDWERTHSSSIEHSFAVKRMLEEGAMLKGTTHTDELMFSLNGENIHYGTPFNPTSIDRIPGGSSSGSAVAVAASEVDFALGTDTGGSIRIPASYCGVYGFRPTHGLISVEGVIPLAKRFDTVGWMTREPELLYKIGTILMNQDYSLPSFRRIIIPEDIIELCSSECQHAFSKQKELMKPFVETIDSINLASEGMEIWLNTFRTLQGYQIWREHGQWIEEHQPTFGTDIDQRFKWAKTIKKEEYDQAVLQQRKLKDQFVRLLGEDSLLMMPTAPSIAPLLRAKGEKLEEQRKRTLLMTCVSGLIGAPQVSVPAMSIDGLPVGLSFIGSTHQDLRLLHWVKEYHEKVQKGASTIEISDHFISRK